MAPDSGVEPPDCKKNGDIPVIHRGMLDNKKTTTLEEGES